VGEWQLDSHGQAAIDFAYPLVDEAGHIQSAYSLYWTWDTQAAASIA
jgi:hypothetical protein